MVFRQILSLEIVIAGEFEQTNFQSVCQQAPSGSKTSNEATPYRTCVFSALRTRLKSRCVYIRLNNPSPYILVKLHVWKPKKNLNGLALLAPVTWGLVAQLATVFVTDITAATRSDVIFQEIHKKWKQCYFRVRQRGLGSRWRARRSGFQEESSDYLGPNTGREVQKLGFYLIQTSVKIYYKLKIVSR